MKKPKVSEKIRTSLFGRGTKRLKKIKKFTRKEIIARLDKAKKSKREFTYFG